jgi:hypothetical protein
LTVAVRNVNTSGFEISLKSEEAITTNLTGFSPEILIKEE